MALLAAYLLFGYFAGPYLVQPRLEHYLAGHFGRELRIGQLQVDPITWSVQLQAVTLPANEQGLWPGLTLSADRVDMRFSFWRLEPVISELKLQAPTLILDTESMLMQSGRYPFNSLWRQWQLHDSGDSKPESVAIKNFRIDSGKVLIDSSNVIAADRTVLTELTDIFLRSSKLNAEVIREFELAFSVTDQADIQMQGRWNAEDLTSTGHYQLAAATAESRMGFQTEGVFASHLLADELQLDLSQSQLHGSSFSACMLEGLICTAMDPLAADFEASLLVASDGVRLIQGNARSGAFQLDASLGRGSVELARRQVFDSAQIDLSLPEAGLIDGTDINSIQNFIIRLFAADGSSGSIEGQIDFQSQHTEAEFSMSGKHEFSGVLQVQRFGSQREQAAFSQLKVQLDNPTADLIEDFNTEYLDHRIEAKNLQLQLTARMDELGLGLQETIRLEQPRLILNTEPVPELEARGSSGSGFSTRLDAAWVLALLQAPDDSIMLEIPQLEMDTATATGLRELIQRQTFSTLKAISDQPFEGLAKTLQIGGRNLDEIHFAAGSAALDVASEETLDDLAAILLQRPGLGLELAGVYDLLIDKKALQTEQIRTHIALATAADLSFRSGSAPTDFNDPKVHSVIDEFARRRLPAKVIQSFAEHFGQADVDQGVLPEGEASAYYELLFELLVDYAEIPQGALTTLARYRAQAVMDGLEQQGVARERLLATTQPIISAARVDGVPLPLQLTLWTGKHAATSEQ